MFTCRIRILPRKKRPHSAKILSTCCAHLCYAAHTCSWLAVASTRVEFLSLRPLPSAVCEDDLDGTLRSYEVNNTLSIPENVCVCA